MIKMPNLNFKERIYDPDLGTGISSTEYLFEKYYKSEDVENYFISFTRVDKLGINPQSKYKTPLGIYTYPVEQFFDLYVGYVNSTTLANEDKWKKIGEFAPFAGDSPYVWVMKVSEGVGRFIDDITTTYDWKDFEDDIDWLIENKKDQVIIAAAGDSLALLHQYIREALVDSKIVASEREADELTTDDLHNYLQNKDYKEAIVDYILRKFGRDARYNQHVGGQMWNITRLVAEQDPVTWNKLWREMGYVGIADRSQAAIIHENESMQAVFFSKKGFTVVDKIENVEEARDAGIAPRRLRKIIRQKLDRLMDSINMFMADIPEEHINFDKFDLPLPPHALDILNALKAIESEIIDLDKFLLPLPTYALDTLIDNWKDILKDVLKGWSEGITVEENKKLRKIINRLRKEKRIQLIHSPLIPPAPGAPAIAIWKEK
jgi:hypothetical protein